MDKKNSKNTNDKEKNKNTIDELNSTEEDILKLGDYIFQLLNLIKDALEGNNKCADDCKNQLKEIFKLIDNIKKNLHDLVEKVYTKKNLTYLSNLSKDLKEKEIELNNIINVLKQYCFAPNNSGSTQINNYDKKSPFVLKK